MKRQLNRATPAGAKIRPVSRTTISDEIIEQIIGLIESGDLQPGQRLPPERELCARFGTGRSSLREALRCLSIVGVLHARVGDGTSVALDSRKFLGKVLHWRMISERHDVENLMEVRIALESMTVSSVALRRTAEDLTIFNSLLAKMKAAVEDQKRFLALDVEFHLALANASGNSLALDLITMIRGQLAKTLGYMLKLPSARPLSLQEHIRIVRMIEKRDREGARRAMHDHLQAALDRYQKTTPRDSLRPAEDLEHPGRRSNGSKGASLGKAGKHPA